MIVIRRKRNTNLQNKSRQDCFDLRLQKSENQKPGKDFWWSNKNLKMRNSSARKILRRPWVSSFINVPHFADVFFCGDKKHHESSFISLSFSFKPDFCNVSQFNVNFPASNKLKFVQLNIRSWVSVPAKLNDATFALLCTEKTKPFCDKKFPLISILKVTLPLFWHHVY